MTDFQRDYYAIKEAAKDAAAKYDRSRLNQLHAAMMAMSHIAPQAYCWLNGSEDYVDDWLNQAKAYRRPPEVSAVL